MDELTMNVQPRQWWQISTAAVRALSAQLMRTDADMRDMRMMIEGRRTYWRRRTGQQNNLLEHVPESLAAASGR